MFQMGAVLVVHLFFGIFLTSANTVYAQSDPSFACLDNVGPTEIVTGFYGTQKFQPDTAPFKKFDARTASFEIPETISHSMVLLQGSGDDQMCWAGGYFTASLNWHNLDISWYESKHGYDNPNPDDPNRGQMENTTSASSFGNLMTWTGLYVYNVHDGMRTTNTQDNWKIQHTWLDYIRDDCLENDHFWSGEIFDSLFDGCYSGISVSPSSTGYSSVGKTIKLDRVLLRMEPMPYPYKWETRTDPMFTIPGYGDTPFGYGNTFKMDSGNIPNFEITNSVFLHEYTSGKELFPPVGNITACANNTLIWLGNISEAPTSLINQFNTAFPGCFTIITDRTQGKAFWKNKVADWHARHPGVGANRKPAVPGEYTWPRYSLNVLMGDANGDRVVDGRDYIVWLLHYGQNVSGATNGDFNSNGTVDGLDYVIWLTNYSR